MNYLIAKRKISWYKSFFSWSVLGGRQSTVVPATYTPGKLWCMYHPSVVYHALTWSGPVKPVFWREFPDNLFAQSKISMKNFQFRLFGVDKYFSNTPSSRACLKLYCFLNLKILNCCFGQARTLGVCTIPQATQFSLLYHTDYLGSYLVPVVFQYSTLCLLSL